MSLIGEISVGDASSRGSFFRGGVLWGNVRRGCVRESFIGVEGEIQKQPFADVLQNRCS